MLLRDWLKDNPSRRSLLESRTQAHPITIARWAAGLSIPRPPMMDLVREITEGEVTVADHYAALAEGEKRRAEKAERKRLTQAEAA